MADPDLTVAILREIRDEVRGTNTRLDGTNARLDKLETSLNGRIDETNQRLGVVEGTLKDLAGQQLILTRYVKNIADRHEQEIDDLRERMVRVETKLGS